MQYFKCAYCGMPINYNLLRFTTKNGDKLTFVPVHFDCKESYHGTHPHQSDKR